MGYRAFRLFVLSLVLIAAAAPFRAWAQPQAQQQPQAGKPAPAPNPFANVPDAYFKEADAYRDECENKPSMHQYYNCDCLSLEYLKRRIDHPRDTKNSIVLAINRTCPDATEAAGHEYQQCLRNSSLAPTTSSSPEKYCECFANTYAKLFEKSGRPTGTNTFIDLETQAYIACDNPDLAKKLYPDAPAQ